MLKGRAQPYESSQYGEGAAGHGPPGRLGAALRQGAKFPPRSVPQFPRWIEQTGSGRANAGGLQPRVEVGNTSIRPRAAGQRAPTAPCLPKDARSRLCRTKRGFCLPLVPLCGAAGPAGRQQGPISSERGREDRSSFPSSVSPPNPPGKRSPSLLAARCAAQNLCRAGSGLGSCPGMSDTP